MPYSENAIRLATELSAKSSANLVQSGYTVWSDVKTHRVSFERPVQSKGYYCSKDHSQGYIQSANMHWHPGVPRAPRVEKPRRNFCDWVRSMWSRVR